MGQMKLSATQRKAVSDAYRCICSMCSWEDTSRGRDYWLNVKISLSAMIAHGTTDGKPYVEPQPEIGEGYRVAVAGDESRQDAKLWVAGDWSDRPASSASRSQPFDTGVLYIVPVDRIPTDDDARQRPLVMVRDIESEKWWKATLLYVASRGRKFVVADDEVASPWRYCRFPYPGE